MELNGTQFIAAPKDVVWQALNNLEFLRQSIPGCDALDEIGANKFRATVRAKIGPVSAAFVSSIQLSEIDAPNGYVISGEGQGVAGFGGGKAVVTLRDADGGTNVTYAVTASVGGKLAQIGSRLIDAAAAKLAGEFFSKFGDLIMMTPPDDEPPAVAKCSAAPEDELSGLRHGWAISIAAASLLALVILTLRAIWLGDSERAATTIQYLYTYLF